MNYEHEPRNLNKGGISRSGNVTGFTATDRHPSDKMSLGASVLTMLVAAVAGWGFVYLIAEAIGA